MRTPNAKPREEAPQVAAFGKRFGDLEVNVANLFHAPGHPEVMILSNMKDEAGKPLGLNDAGQGWHTDMSYSKEIALANMLHAQARAPSRWQGSGCDAIPQHARQPMRICRPR